MRQNVFRSMSVVVALAVLSILALFVIPLPPAALDILLVINILITLSLLLSVLFVDEPSRLFSFPTIILLLTLYRLALNVSSTRLILLRGDGGLDAAGQVIESFGAIVVQGDFLVGAIIFTVIALVNFIVIAKGSARVAEVSARFNLDALPGRQLAIDADMRAGNISKEVAQRRREDLSRESQFYGAMDGAMKFVQGDAIAGLAIAVVNAIGGISIGSMLRGMSVGDAINTFGVLTIGDGLVSIIPSLLVSVCAGIVVTHIAGRSRDGSGTRVVQDLFSEPRAIVFASLALVVVSLIPGFPFLPFFAVGMGLLVFLALRQFAWSGRLRYAFDPSDSYYGLSIDSSDDSTVALPYQSGQARIGESFGTFSILSLQIDPESYRGHFADGTEGRAILTKSYGLIAERVYRERGVVLPPFSITPSEDLSLGSMTFLVREQIVTRAHFSPDEVMILCPPTYANLFSVRSLRELRHPIDHRKVVCAKKHSKGLSALRELDVKIIEPFEYFALELAGAGIRHIEELFGLNEVKKLLEPLRKSHPMLMEEVFENQMLTYPEFAELVRRLVRERVSVRDLKLILEGVSEFYSQTPLEEDRQQWLSDLHSFIRLVLKRGIIQESRGDRTSLRVFPISTDLESEFRSAMSMWDNPRSKLPIDPHVDRPLREQVQRMFTPVLERGALPVVLLCGSDVRHAVHDYFSREFDTPEWLRTLSYEEVDGSGGFETIATLGL